MPNVRELSFATDVGERAGVLALPETADEPVPGVVVIHDITGFKPDTRRHCQRFAEAGYAAIAPDLYAGGGVGCVVRTLLAMRANEGEPYAIIAGARRALAAREDVDEERIGVTGFCMGGGFALVAAADDAYAVAAPFYGMVPKEAGRLSGICPTLAQYGERDTAFLSHGRRLARHLEELGVPHEVLFHPGVGHSFMNDHAEPLFELGAQLPPLHAAYDAPTEEKAWKALLDFFDRHMGEDGKRAGAA